MNTDVPSSCGAGADGLQQSLEQALEPALKPAVTQSSTISTATVDTQTAALSQYLSDRANILREECIEGFDFHCSQNATPAERLANLALLEVKRMDKQNVFDAAAKRKGYGNQEHPRIQDDHFLSNEPLIKRTELLRAAKEMPKGSHLHIHFNACLEPHVLLEVAMGMDRMFITSDLPLIKDADRDNFFLCEIQFSILSPEKEKPGNLFSADYQPRQTMRFQDFLQQFSAAQEQNISAMEWLASKLVFSEEETYDALQTARGAWERFNGRTRMMKGLFNYETAYRKYTMLFLEDLLNDNIQYAEIRPNFMMTNQIWNDAGTAQLDNAGIVELIIEACEKFKARKHTKHFDGIKIIYCTPRSFSKDLVKGALDECLAFKQKWPNYIAGFDLVGEEANGQPLNCFVDVLLQFKEDCKGAGVNIPFLFHCGESLDDIDNNLVDALLLGSKRIGHGFALPGHPLIMEKMKNNGVCVEVCPISNELLGLTPRIGNHAVYNLLANNVPCTVNSDNGTLFKSSLSHDFYQVMVGRSNMSLFGWRQLAEWSLEHACLSASEIEVARRNWLDAWRTYIIWLLETYGSKEDAHTKDVLAAIKADNSRAANASF